MSLRARELPALRRALEAGHKGQAEAARARIQGALGISRQDLRDALGRAEKLGAGEVALVRVAADAVEAEIARVAAEAGVAPVSTYRSMVGPGFGSPTGDLVAAAGDPTLDEASAPPDAHAWPRDPAGMRRVLIQLVARDGFDAVEMKVTGLLAATPFSLDPAGAYRTARLASEQLARLRSEADTFEKAFERAATGAAKDLLGESEREIAAALEGYGLDTSPQALTLMSSLLIKDADFLDTAIETLMRTSRSGRHKDAFAARSASAHRDSLARAVRELVGQQHSIDRLTDRRAALVDQQIHDDHCHSGHHRDERHVAPDDPRWRSMWEMVDAGPKRPQALSVARDPRLGRDEQLARVNQDIIDARTHYQTRWCELERTHPMLAAYRTSDGTPDRDAVERLGRPRDGDQAVRSLLATLLPKVANIHKTRLALRDGSLSALELPPVVELTCARLGVAPGSLHARVVEDAAADARSGGWKRWAINAVTLGLSIVATVASGGTALPLVADLGALSFGAYSLGEAYDDFKIKGAAADTAADPSLALTHEKPSATALVTQAAALAFGAGLAARSLREATTLAPAEDAAAGAAALPDEGFHLTTSPGATRGVLGGIDKDLLNKRSRFGKAFYAAERPETALAELKHHHAVPTHSIRYSVNLRGVRLVDLTDPKEAAEWMYAGGDINATTRAIGELARELGYTAIRFSSERGPGANLAILDDFEYILKPLMVSPTK